MGCHRIEVEILYQKLSLQLRSILQFISQKILLLVTFQLIEGSGKSSLFRGGEASDDIQQRMSSPASIVLDLVKTVDPLVLFKGLL